jgi:hypothetical protein
MSDEAEKSVVRPSWEKQVARTTQGTIRRSTRYRGNVAVHVATLITRAEKG